MAKTGKLATVETEIVEALRTKRQRPTRPDPPITKKLYRMHELVAVIGRSRASIYADVRQGRFPRPIRLGPRSVGWVCREVELWVEQRAAERDSQHAA